LRDVGEVDAETERAHRDALDHVRRAREIDEGDDREPEVAHVRERDRDEAVARGHAPVFPALGAQWMSRDAAAMERPPRPADRLLAQVAREVGDVGRGEDLALHHPAA
jgi:hypothetical protein